MLDWGDMWSESMPHELRQTWTEMVAAAEAERWAEFHTLRAAVRATIGELDRRIGGQNGEMGEAWILLDLITGRGPTASITGQVAPITMKNIAVVYTH